MTPRALATFSWLAVLFLGTVSTQCAGGPEITPDPPSEPRFVGRRGCAECHPDQERLWRGSHHDLAMQEALDSTVLGDFDGAQLSHAGVTSTFFRRDGGFWVRTDGSSGELEEYEIAYTFGAVPLQQYLIELPGGRRKAAGAAGRSRGAGDRPGHGRLPDAGLPDPRIPVGDRGRSGGR